MFPLNITNAQGLQQYLTSFVTSGIPSSPLGPTFPLYSSSKQILSLKNSFSIETNDVNTTRCAFWQQGLFNGQNISDQGIGIAVGPAGVISAAPADLTVYTGSVAGSTSPSAPVAQGAVGFLATAATTDLPSTTSTHASTSASHTTSGSHRPEYQSSYGIAALVYTFLSAISLVL